MKHLAKRRPIIITTADKGGAVVIMNIENYIKETIRQISYTLYQIYYAE